jgi:phosphatidyl-myo-inositol dimannoside synthase
MCDPAISNTLVLSISLLMNILYTITRYWPAIGGAETHVRQVASALASRHTVQIAAHTNRQQVDPIRISTIDALQSDVYSDGATHIQLLGVTSTERMWIRPAVRLYQYPRTKKLGYWLYASVFAKKLSQLVRERQIDLIHNVLVGTEYLSHVSCQVARHHGIPFVITPLVHEGLWGDSDFFLQVYRQADAVIALLNEERRFYLESGIPSKNIHVIGVSPVLTENYDASFFKKRGIKGKTVLFVGRQIQSKGYYELLSSAAQTWARHPDVHFIFVGPNEEANSVFTQFNDPRIINLGRVSDEEKTSALAACDIFCLPSNSEIMPTVILEAWHFGKPVIGGSIATLQELIQNGENGLIVRQDPQDISSAIINLLDDPVRSQQMGMSGRQKVQQYYGIEQVSTQLEAVYHDLTGKG